MPQDIFKEQVPFLQLLPDLLHLIRIKLPFIGQSLSGRSCLPHAILLLS